MVLKYKARFSVCLVIPLIVIWSYLIKCCWLKRVQFSIVPRSWQTGSQFHLIFPSPPPVLGPGDYWPGDTHTMYSWIEFQFNQDIKSPHDYYSVVYLLGIPSEKKKKNNLEKSIEHFFKLTQGGRGVIPRAFLLYLPFGSCWLLHGNLFLTRLIDTARIMFGFFDNNPQFYYYQRYWRKFFPHHFNHSHLAPTRVRRPHNILLVTW